MTVFLYNLSIPHSNVSEARYKNQLTTDRWACIPARHSSSLSIKKTKLTRTRQQSQQQKRKKKQLKNERGKKTQNKKRLLSLTG